MKKLSALNNSKFYNSPNIIEKFSFNNWCKFFLTTILLVLKFIHKSFSFPDILLFLKIACKHLFIYKTYLLLTLVTVLPPVGFFLGSMMVLFSFYCLVFLNSESFVRFLFHFLFPHFLNSERGSISCKNKSMSSNFHHNTIRGGSTVSLVKKRTIIGPRKKSKVVFRFRTASTIKNSDWKLSTG